MRMLAIIAVLFWGSASSAAPFAIQFESERVDLAVMADSLEVRGHYVLRCNEVTNRPVTVFYPFPADSLLGGARLVSATCAGSPARWEVSPGLPGVRIWIEPCQADTVVVEAVYRQALRTEYARYIVTTTRAWGQPLRHAAFTIRLPDGATPLAFSFPFTRREGAVYVYETDDFYPDRDIIVRWRP